MEIGYTLQALKDIDYWKNKGDINVQRKISELLHSMEITPYSGIGKPEPLKYKYAGFWSRRINREHRIIYEVFEDRIIIHSLVGHYQ